MASKPALKNTKKRRGALELLPIVLAFAAVTILGATKPWLKTTIGGPMFNWIAAAVVTFGLGCSWYASIRSHRREDEVQKAVNAFAARWGMLAGQAAFGLLLMLPPFREFMTAFVIEHGGPGPGMTVDQSVIVFAMAMGFLGVVLLQTIGMVVVGTVWWKSKQ